jgi:hypothetical protein
MSFHAGQKVVCINDCFPKVLYEFAFMIPRKGSVYTVRELKVCTHVVTNSRELGLRFVELNNPRSDFRRMDGTMSHGEPFFSAWRFRPLADENVEQEKAAEELELSCTM